ncbi:MAG: MamK family actin-like protein [Planctomycetota bacterium]|jgi:rod shape-determining protein MreB
MKKPEKATARGATPVTPKPGEPLLSGNEQDSGMVQNVQLLGIDLGTSRSSIVSMNGSRRTIDSYVGWPTDAVSRKLFKSDVVFGRAALDNRLALDLYRPLERGVIKGTDEQTGQPSLDNGRDLEAAALLLKHLVKQVNPARDEVLYGVVGVPTQATVKNKRAIIDCARDVLDGVMVVSEPFAVAYGLERISDVLVIDMGAGTTDLCRMHGTVPADEDQIGLDIAGDAIDQKLHDLILAKYPEAQLTVNMCKEMKEQYGFVRDARDRIEVPIPVDGKPVMHDVTKQMNEACSIIIEPILEGIHRLVASFNPEFQERLRHNIILSGGGGMLDGLILKLEEGLSSLGGGHVTHVDEPLYAGASGALQLAVDMPGEFWEQLQ